MRQPNRQLTQIPEPWNSFLSELDQRVTEETRLDCMGGFVVTVLYGFSRETSDLHVLLIAPQEQRALYSNLVSREERSTRNTRSIWTM
jgi:hypothetical protein